ncbi:biopolymer transport protein ExbD [Segatella buccae]|uniref:Biopolymer transport protein ExbD n=1 Tax=Segatella buccae TaxID=28126 RepID=A0AAQ1ULH6_9BACT|nr:biopolymer transporter ExbD [Segatella buccae]SUB80711.1 biopolymer transport protein ExbD [Segatella buccae]
MGKVKIKKSDVWIDMTPMSDVMVLLLTFFMLTSTFVKNEPVKVVTPGSVSEIKVPEKDVLNILVNKDGRIFMSMDKVTDLEAALQTITAENGISLNGEQIKKFKDDAMFGAPLDKLSDYLSQDKSDMSAVLPTLGIPTDSVKMSDGTMGKSEFQQWVSAAKEVNPDIKLAIKSDQNTPYKVVKKVMDELRDMEENRYYLITSYKKMED